MNRLRASNGYASVSVSSARETKKFITFCEVFLLETFDDFEGKFHWFSQLLFLPDVICVEIFDSFAPLLRPQSLIPGFAIQALPVAKFKHIRIFSRNRR